MLSNRQGTRQHSSKDRARRQNKFKVEIFTSLEDRTVPTIDLATTGMIADEILVQYTPGTNVQQRALSRYNLNVQLKEEIDSGERLNMGDGVLELIKLPAGLTNSQALDWFARQPGVIFAEPNYHVSASYVSNDPYYASGQLWGMEGSDTPTAVGPAGTTNTYGINAEAAWNEGQIGSKTVFVGIVDTGVQITHPDIAENIWTNPYDPADGIDNDGNGFVDDVHGWDFVNNDNTVYDSVNDDHGTHVAGTIGGKGGNGAGVAGVNWNVTMIPAKFLGTTGGTTADAVRAIDYITDLKNRHAMNIVATNNSWGGGGYSAALHSAIIRAAKSNILTVIAAGNSSSNNDAVASYPSNTSTLVGTSAETAASYEGVIAVASLESTGLMSSFSNYGKTTVDLAAPGGGIYSSVPSNAYASYSGTSMATPHVTGSVALLAAKYPNATADQLRTAILATATPTASQTGKTVTGGRLNVQAALNYSGFSTQPPVVPSVTIGDVTAVEGNSGTKSFLFPVSLSSSTTSNVVINYSTADGTAQAGSDYVAATGSITIPAGSTTGQIAITVNGDTVVETDETFNVQLALGGTNATLGDGSGLGTIQNDDAAPPVVPTLSMASVSQAEGNSGTLSMVFTVTMSQAIASAVTVNYATADGTAQAGSDYVAKTGTLTIPAGATSGQITVTINGDTAVEADESFKLALSGVSSNATIATGSATGTIVNDDTAPPPAVPTLSIANAAKLEGNSGTSNLVFTVSLSGATTSAVTVNYATANVSATAGVDYVAKSGTLTIPAGATSGQITVVINGDTTVEADETFKVTLSGVSSNATLATSMATGTIQNDDSTAPPVTPTLSIADASLVEGNSGTTNMVFTVSLSAATTTPVLVDYYTSGITALAGEDYAAQYATLTIPAGAVSGTVVVPIYGDTKVEGDETFAMYLTNPSKNAKIGVDHSTGTILNDDVLLTTTITATNASVAEGDSGYSYISFTLTRTGNLNQKSSVFCYTDDTYGTATEFADYWGDYGTVTFRPGESTKTVKIQVYGDTTVEADETFDLVLAYPTNAVLAVDHVVGTIVNDDFKTFGLSDGANAGGGSELVAQTLPGSEQAVDAALLSIAGKRRLKWMT